MSTVHTRTEAMPAETLEALRGSIAKWEGIVAGTVENHGTSNCPLCKEFRWSSYGRKGDCEGCPVKAVTGRVGCVGTPYHDYTEIQHLPVGNDEKRKRAQLELDFLKSLLPTDVVTDEEQSHG